MINPGQLQDEQHAALSAKVDELARVSVSHGAELAALREAKESMSVRLAAVEAQLAAADDDTVDVEPPSIIMDGPAQEYSPGDVILFDTSGIPEGSRLWVHWFKGGWGVDPIRRAGIVDANGLVEVRILDTPGDYILQLQDPVSGAKAHRNVMTLGEATEPDTPTVPAIPADPKPDYDLPDLPQVTKRITLKPGQNDIADQVSKGPGTCTEVIGNPDTIITDFQNIGSASLIIRGAAMRSVQSWDGATFVKGRRGAGSSCWLFDVDFEGRDYRNGGSDTFTPVADFDRVFYVDSAIRQVRRGVNQNGYQGVYGCDFVDIGEDFYQGSGTIIDTTVKNLAQPRFPAKAHPDVLQLFGTTRVNNLMVNNYDGQVFALGNTGASGSTLTNIRVVGKNGTTGMGLYIEDADGKGGPSNITLENVVTESSFYIRREGSKAWKGKNLVLKNCVFAGQRFDDEVFHS